MSFLHTMRGPEFLALYFLWFLLSWVGMMLIRHRVSDTVITTLTGLFLFEGLGVARFIVGVAHGMEKWDFLIAMMVVGALFFLLRAEHLKQGSGGGSGSCSGGGGCGGGGCGGGGCGGCGGS